MHWAVERLRKAKTEPTSTAPSWMTRVTPVDSESGADSPRIYQPGRAATAPRWSVSSSVPGKISLVVLDLNPGGCLRDCGLGILAGECFACFGIPACASNIHLWLTGRYCKTYLHSQYSPTSTPTATFTPSPTFTSTETPTNTPIPTDTPLPTDTPRPANTAKPLPTDTSTDYSENNGERWIDVNLSQQMLYAYEGDTIVASFLVSTGVPQFPTVTGRYHIYIKLVSTLMAGDGYYLPDVPYTMYFYKGYGIHGTYWHNNFGHPMSYGCVNMYTPDAEWMFYWASVGTLVNVHY